MSSLDLIISSTVSITSCTSLLSLSDYLLQFFQTNDAQLSTMVAEQVEQAHAGINALALSQETINKLRENFIDIDK